MSHDAHFRILIKLSDQVQSFIITKNSFTVGRSKKADLQIPNEYLSNLHFRFDVVAENKFAVTDLGSTNGTCLKGIALIPNKPVHYNAGEEIVVKADKIVKLKILPLPAELHDSPSETKRNEAQKIVHNEILIQIENGKKELAKITKMIKINYEAYEVEKENRRIEMLKTAENYKKQIQELKESSEKLLSENMAEGLKVASVKEEIEKLCHEKNELKEIIETQYRALKTMTQKEQDAKEMLDASESSLCTAVNKLNIASEEYEKLSANLGAARDEYEKLKHVTDILSEEKKKLIEIYQKEKALFDSEMAEKRKVHMDELNKQLEEFNDQALKKRTELDYLKTEYDLKQKAFDENLLNYEIKEKEKIESEFKNQMAKMSSELLFYRSEIKNAAQTYKLKMAEQELKLENEKRKYLDDLDVELNLVKENRLKTIINETEAVEKLQKEKEEQVTILQDLRQEVYRQRENQKTILEDLNKENEAAIKEAEYYADKEIRTMKFRKVQELSETISHHIAKDLLARRGRTLDDEYVEKSAVAIKRLIVERMLESKDDESERTRQLVLGDELKKFRTKNESAGLFSYSVVASVAAILFVVLSASLIFPEKVAKTKKILTEKVLASSQFARKPAQNPK